MSILGRASIFAAHEPIRRFRPSMPPLALQSALADLATLLRRSVSTRPRELVKLGEAVLVGLEGWSGRPHARILDLLADVVIECVRQLPGVREASQALESREHISSNVPIAIKIDAPETSRLEQSVSKRALDVEGRAEPSTYAGEQSALVYRLTALVAPVLSAALARDVGDNSVLGRFISTLARTKSDLYLDALEIVAYGSSNARRGALRVLTSYWPRAIGHPSAVDQGRHEWVPWCFPTLGRPTPCLDCGQPVTGFALRCSTGSHAPLHLSCLNGPDGCVASTQRTEQGTQKLSLARYSVVETSRRATTDDPRLASVIRVDRHILRLVNLFTVALCFVCRTPCWGILAQALKCDHCDLFAHRSCLVGAKRRAVPRCEKVDQRHERDVMVDWIDLRKSWLAHSRELVLDDKMIGTRSHEEIATLHSCAWLQLKLLEAGVAAGTIRIDKMPEQVSDFELHYIIAQYSAYLASGRLARSSILTEFTSVTGPLPNDPLFTQMALLELVVSLLRSPMQTTDDALRVPTIGGETEVSDFCFETARSSLLLDVLARDFGLRSPVAGRALLSWLLGGIGLVERVDGLVTLPSDDADVDMTFSLPLLLDPSLSVETLIVATETTLADPDLSVQESGLLLLSRRCTPSPLVSTYALSRLARALCRWIMDESALFAAALTAGLVSKSAVSGSAYQIGRSRLLSGYAAPWFALLHDLDTPSFIDMLFESLASLAADACVDAPREVFADRLVRDLARLAQANVVFDTFDRLFARWLDECATHFGDVSNEGASFRSVVRLFNREGSSGEPSEVGLESMLKDPWRVIMSTAGEGLESYSQALRWIRLLARSGVDVETERLQSLAQLLVEHRASLEVAVLFIDAVFAAVSGRFGRQSAANVACAVLVDRSESILKALKTDQQSVSADKSQFRR